MQEDLRTTVLPVIFPDLYVLDFCISCNRFGKTNMCGCCEECVATAIETIMKELEHGNS